MRWSETNTPPHPIPFGFAMTDIVTEFPRELLPRLRLAALVDRLECIRRLHDIRTGRQSVF